MLLTLRCGAPVGMKWFRSNIKTGSRLALFALAIQFALSFGHFHEAAAQTPRPGLTGADLAHAALDAASELQQQQPSDHDTDQHKVHACVICAVNSLANNFLFGVCWARWHLLNDFRTAATQGYGMEKMNWFKRRFLRKHKAPA